MTVKTEGLGRLRFELHAGNGRRRRVASVSGSNGQQLANRGGRGEGETLT